MQNFWNGFEKRAQLEKTAIWGNIAHGIATHVIPNTVMLKALKSKRVAENIGQHFSSGLFNTPVSARSAFFSGATAGVAPEIPMIHHHARELGSKMREHLGEGLAHHLGTEGGINAMKEVLKGNVTGGYKYSPELTDAVLEFAKQNKTNPLLLAANMKNVATSKDHPLISKILPNIIQMPRRAKIKPTAPLPKPGSQAAMEAEMQNVLDQQSMKRFIPKSLRGKPKVDAEDFAMPEAGPKIKQGPRAGKDLAKGEAKISPEEDAAMGEMARSFTHPKTTKMKKMVQEGYDRAMGAGSNTEAYIPPLEQILGPKSSSRPWIRGMGAMAGSAGVGAIDPITGGVNAAKYMYFGTPLRGKVRDALSKKKGLGWLPHAEDAVTTKRLTGAFERGLVKDKDLNPITNAFHRYMWSGIQGEAARTSNAVGRGIAGAVAPEHRKNVYENIMGALHGVPGSLQAQAPAESLGKQLKPFAAPAAISAGAGALAYGAGKYQNSREQGRPQVTPGGNVLPFIRPPQMQQPMGAMG